MKFFDLDQAGIGEDLKRAREHLGLTLKEVATQSGVALSHVWNLENGVKEMSLEKFFSLCCALGLSGSQVIADNTKIDYDTLFECAIRQLKEHNPKMEEKLILFYANYYAACAVVVLHMLLTPGSDMPGAHFSFPTQGIRDAFAALNMKLRMDASLRTRKDYIDAIQANLIGVIDALGLGTVELFTGYVDYVGEQNKASGSFSPWKPTTPKTLNFLISDFKDRLPNYDPQKMGRIFREMDEGGISAFIKKAKKKKPRGKKLTKTQ